MWASYQIHKIEGCACAGNAGNVFPVTDFKGHRELAISGCITVRAWRTCRDACQDGQPAVAGKTFPAFPAQYYVSDKRPMSYLCMFVEFLLTLGKDAVERRLMHVLKRCHLTSIGNPVVETRLSLDRLLSTIGSPIQVRRHHFIESGPRGVLLVSPIYFWQSTNNNLW